MRQLQIHLDWYKASIYASDAIRKSDPLLAHLGTRSTTPHRFHACERRWKCDETWGDGIGCYEWAEEYLPMLKGPKKLKRQSTPTELASRDSSFTQLVYINPAEMPKWKWDRYKERLRDTMDSARASERTGGLRVPAQRPDCLVSSPSVRSSLAAHAFFMTQIVPLARHSSLPELQRFVSVFKPRTLYPLTIIDDRQRPGRDYLSLPALFADCLAPGGEQQLAAEAKAYVKSKIGSRPATTVPLSSADVVRDDLLYFVNAENDRSALNIEGGDAAIDLITMWTQMDIDESPSHPMKGATHGESLAAPAVAPTTTPLPPSSPPQASVLLPSLGPTSSPPRHKPERKRARFAQKISSPSTETRPTCSSTTAPTTSLNAFATASAKASSAAARMQPSPPQQVHMPPPPKLPTPPRAVNRPSPAFRAQRQRIRSVIVKKLGGLIGPGGVVVPRSGPVVDSRGAAVTPECDSFKTVPATVSPMTSGSGTATASGSGSRNRTSR